MPDEPMIPARKAGRLFRAMRDNGAIRDPSTASQFLRDRVDTPTRRSLMDNMFPELRPTQKDPTCPST